MLEFGAAWRVALGVAAAGLLALTGCGKGEGEGSGTGGGAGGTGAGGTGAPEIVVGHFASMTGPQATFGVSTDNGIRLAIAEVNAQGGLEVNGQRRMVRLVTDDTEGRPDRAATVVTKLITRDRAIAILGEVASGVSLQGAPVAQQFGVPMISPSSTNPAVTQVGDMIFRVCFLDPFQGFAGAKFVRTELNFTKAAILFDQQSPYSVGLKDAFVSAFTQLGGTVVTEQAYTEGLADFSAQLSRIREAAPDVIFVPGYYTDVANIAIQARRLGLRQPLMGGDGWDSEELGKNAGEAIVGSFYTNHYAIDNPTPEIQRFVADYQKMFGGATPDGLAALGYDAAGVLFAAIQRAGTTDGKALRDAIAATRDFRAVTGNITLNENRDAVKSTVVVERKADGWVYRATIAP